jgi:hypothetical protein
MVMSTQSAAAPPAAPGRALLGRFKIPSSSSGIQNVTGAGAVIVLDSTSVTITLPANGAAVLTADGSPVVLPAATSVAIRSGFPQPYFFLDDFQARYSPDPNNVFMANC